MNVLWHLPFRRLFGLGMIPAVLLRASVGAQTPEADWVGDSATKPLTLKQGWTPWESGQFYHTTQGSRLLP